MNSFSGSFLTVIKSFEEEFHQAILDIEAEKLEFRLCAGHWKAEKAEKSDEEGLMTLIWW